ncbi:fasciclin domain-containing protein [Calidifontimicrobium sp. SYSU G02091]|uniref:fasciclin domain-containing protein n=1 Tax=Calidifontimicrobium sp. SYSU G02091 TaxID=2926421 RepID=UPI001F531B66|nr:fasciclin domain-containing protein [Calidifontimicrobium sp. SYSU G02091]MCI1192099.1 fasciclin domain-containing protein [Calidifontimicrobium sp. SYSU G02091]
MYRWLKYLMATSCVAFLAACGGGDDDDPPATPTTIASVATASGFSALVAAADKAGLVDELSDTSANLTVFAPTDAAFDALATTLGFADATAMVAALDGPTLAKILSYHVLPARKTAAQLTAGDEPTLYEFEGTPATLAIGTTGGVTVTDEVLVAASVTTPDVDAGNGVIHVIDKVLVPPGVLTVVQMATLNPAFSTLVAAVTTAGLDSPVDGLQSAGPFTVFAPTNDAFTALLARLGISANDLLGSPNLGNILRYHVASGAFRAADVLGLPKPASVPTLLSGSNLTVPSNTLPLTLIDDDAGSPDATIAATDVRASNGVIHVITQVLIPAPN